MLSILPERIFKRGKRRIYYQASQYKTGEEIIVIFTTPNMQESSIILKEFGYGLYYFDFDFKQIGDHIGIFFENEEVVGSSIFRIAL